MFDHRNLATEGLYPGLVSTFSIAILGALEFEIIIEPEVPLGGGAGFVRPIDAKYILTIRVSRKGKVWETKTKISYSTAKVFAKFLKIQLPQVEILDTNVVYQEEPHIEVKHAGTTKIR